MTRPCSLKLFTASILFIYIQLLYCCRYVVTIGYLNHCLGAEDIWKLKSKWFSYCEMVCEKIHYLSKELAFFIHHIFLYPQKNSFSKKAKRKCFSISHALRQFWNPESWRRQFRYSASWPACSSRSCLEKPFCALK